MRRSVRRVTTGLKAMTPRTPHKMTFSPIEKKRAGSFGDGLLHKNNNNRTAAAAAAPPERSRARDMEKAAPAAAATTVTAGSRSESPDSAPMVPGKKKQRPTPPRVQVPQSKFEMDSPKTPMWNRVFGR